MGGQNSCPQLAVSRHRCLITSTLTNSRLPRKPAAPYAFILFNAFRRCPLCTNQNGALLFPLLSVATAENLFFQHQCLAVSLSGRVTCLNFSLRWSCFLCAMGHRLNSCSSPPGLEKPQGQAFVCLVSPSRQPRRLGRCLVAQSSVSPV